MITPRKLRRTRTPAEESEIRGRFFGYNQRPWSVEKIKSHYGISEPQLRIVVGGPLKQHRALTIEQAYG